MGANRHHLRQDKKKSRDAMHITYVVLLLKMFHANLTMWKLSNPNWGTVYETNWPDLFTNVNVEKDKKGEKLAETNKTGSERNMWSLSGSWIGGREKTTTKNVKRTTVEMWIPAVDWITVKFPQCDNVLSTLIFRKHTEVPRGEVFHVCD